MSMTPNPELTSTGLITDADVAPDAAIQGTKLQFLQAGTGAVARTQQSKSRERVTPEDFGADGTGAVDATAAIQAAIDSLGTGGGEVFFPGKYLVSGPINVVNDGITLRGKNWSSSKITSSNGTAKIINITGNQCALDNLSIEFSGAMPASIAGQAISVTNPSPGSGPSHGQNVSLTNFRVVNAGVCVYLGYSYVAHISNFQLIGFSQAGLYFDNWIDAYITQFAIQASVGSTMGQLGGIFANNTQAIVASNADVLSGAHAISLTGSSAYCYFANIYCDSTNQDPLYVGSGGANLTKFTNCWFSGGRTGGGYNGANLIQCEGVDFVNCTFVNNGNHGAFVGAGAARVSFDTCRVEGNSVTAASGNGHGIALESGASDFMIRGCTIRNSLFGARQGYGIFFNGAAGRFVITNNNIDGNLAGAINGLPGGTSNWVVDDSNIGYKRPFVSPALSGSWVNYGAAAETVGYIKDASGYVHLQGAAKGGRHSGRDVHTSCGISAGSHARFCRQQQRCIRLGVHRCER